MYANGEDAFIPVDTIRECSEILPRRQLNVRARLATKLLASPPVLAASAALRRLTPLAFVSGSLIFGHGITGDR